MKTFLSVVLIILVAYGLGSISFAYIITKWRTGKDIRDLGSGNAGFSNTLRVLDKKWAALVFLGDMLKGYLACLFGAWLLGPLGGVLGFGFVIIGHSFPFWLNFRGGKGIASGLGALLALMPTVAIIVLMIWIVLVIATRYISVGSVAACVAAPISAILLREPNIYIIFTTVIVAVIIYKHRGNIKRVLNGTESKIGKDKIKL
ncbi:MAG: glycerol-3-phosphate 1-O-acyltransferase PlsY [Clostridia bacterium]|nr:glycerol-3-phosphate 1-O-acyltransferase PlsY [Clostridia bacterium]MDD4571027.1 glycerol-3-phosphate 1-O-acyltransferase PlsY [Clostridia bacterium]